MCEWINSLKYLFDTFAKVAKFRLFEKYVFKHILIHNAKRSQCFKMCVASNPAEIRY